jgi:uncharacterized protein (TIGR02231 family)
MKRSLLAIMVILAASGPALAETIKRAVLYQDMAYVTVERETVNRKAVVVAPPEFIRDSLRVVPAGDGVGRDLSVEPKRTMGGRAKQIRDALTGKKAALEGRQRLQKTIEREIELIFENAGAKGREAVYSRARLSDALSFIDERVGSLNRRHIALAQEIDGLSVEIRDLEEQLKDISGRQGYEISVVMDSDRPVLVSYAVTNCSWRPEYTVHAYPSKGTVRIETSAAVRQATGADWDVEELMVATGRPGFGIQAPELHPWNIGLPVPVLRDSAGISRKAMMSAAPAAEAALEEEIEPEVKATAASYVIGAARSVTLPGDGSQRSIALGRKNVAMEMGRTAAPKYDASVFLRGTGVWEGNTPLLQGTYTSFVDGEYMGRGSMKQAQPGEKVVVDLGRDEGIRVERKEKVFHERTITGRDRTTCTCTITVRNTRTAPVRVTLKDQIPLSLDEAVKVELVEANPRVVPDADGFLAWETDCAPGTVNPVTFTFSVTGMRLF